ncbi:hypothetical protein M8818_000811 [Zalaria obscura]|uniref:Uncharacterized protein n=1 Tax=Zalaria obscura TaxID=2024903 RepID=A0ACC3SMZ9_9PEZI
MASQLYRNPETGQCYCWSVSGQRWVPVDAQWLADRAQASQSQPRSFDTNATTRDVAYNSGVALTGRQGVYNSSSAYQVTPGAQQVGRGPTNPASINSITDSLSDLLVGGAPARSTSSPNIGSYTISGPPEQITDPFFFMNNVHAHKRIPALHGQSRAFKDLDESTVAQNHPKTALLKSFRVSKAKKCSQLLHTGQSVPGSVARARRRHAQWYTCQNSKVYRDPGGLKLLLVLVSWGPASASPANPIRPIVTYQYQGVAKRNVIKSDHAIVYTTREPPSPLSSERPGRNEQPMLPGSIRVHVDDPRDKSHSVSRIHFGKIYTVEHNVRVRALGLLGTKLSIKTPDPTAPSVASSLPQPTTGIYQTQRGQSQLSQSLPSNLTGNANPQNAPLNVLTRAYVAQSQSQAQPSNAQNLTRASSLNVAGPSARGAQATRYVQAENESSEEEVPRKSVPSRRGRK